MFIILEMAGFEIYVEEKNCSGLKRVIRHFWKHGLMPAGPCFIRRILIKNITDRGQILGYGKRWAYQEGNEKSCQNEENIGFKTERHGTGPLW